MAEELASNLRALEALLEEFFQSRTGNARKAEIEKVLAAFSCQPSAWRDCLHFLTHSSSHYVAMFSLTTLETTIRRRWVGMLGEDRAEIRTSLNSFLFRHHTSAPLFIRNKLIKLIVDIARSDWPHFYPEFFPQLLEAVRGGAPGLGLAMLLTASEELATPRGDLPTARAAELRRLMVGEASGVAAALTGLLDRLLEPEGTPPASPASCSRDSEDSANSMDLPSLPPSTPPTLDPGQRAVAGAALRCLAHIITWAPLQTVVSTRLIHVLFQYAGLALRNPQDSAMVELSMLALAAVTEIVYKSYVPPDLTSYLLVLFRGAFHLLQLTVVPDRLLHQLPEEFLAKLTEFLRQLVAAHLRRCGEQSQAFPILEFLSLVFRLTFQQPEAAGLLGCLEIWGAVCDQLGLQGPEVLPAYREPLLGLAGELLRRVQHRHHGAALVRLETEAVTEEGGLTEWQVFLAAVLELVLRVAELLPEDTLRLADAAWRQAAVSFLALEQQLEGGPCPSSLTPLLRDHSTLLQLAGRLCPLYLGAAFPARLSAGLDVTKQLLSVAAAGARLRLWARPATDPATARALVQCQAQTLAALQAWAHWLAALHSESLQDSTYTWVCSDLTSRIVVAVVATLRDGHRDLTHSAAHFLVTLTGTVRPPSIWKVKEFTDLYSAVPRGGLALEGEAHRLVVRSLANVLLLHWPGIPEQRWEDRSKHLAKFLRDLTEGFRSLKTTPGFSSDRALQVEAEPLIVTTLQLLGDLVENVLNEVTQCKKLCHDVTREYIEISLWLFPLYVQSAKVCEEMFHFFHIVFDVLAAQMGSEFVEQAVQTFFSLFGHSLLAQVIRQKNASLESRVVEKFLSILTFIVSEPGPTFRKFVPSTLVLCLDQIFPLVLEQETSELRAPVYSLLHHTLLHNWNYFFKSSLAVTSLAQLNNNQTEVVQHREQFLALMGAIGQSFMQLDIAVFSQNIATLQLLNAKWRLYSRRVFQESLLAEFLSVLLRVLVAKSHDLLKDDIGGAVYHMASTSLATFHSDFLPTLLLGLDGLDDNQRGVLVGGFKVEPDMPSFLANLDRFVTDIRYYRLVNESLSQPAVKL